MTVARQAGGAERSATEGERRRARVRRLLSLTLTIALSATYFAVGTDSEPPAVFSSVPDSTSHALGYGALALSSLATAIAWNVPVATAAAGGYAMVHGAALEGLQSASRTRRAEWRDLAWDLSGVVAVLGTAAAVRRAVCRR